MHSTIRTAPPARLLLLALVVGLSLMLPVARPARAAGVVGNGTPASCTEAALAAALAGGGTVTFNCGGPATITIATTLEITAPETTIDGGGLITLRGSNTRIIRHRTFGLIGSSVLTLKNLTITEGRAAGVNKAANGGAVQSVFEAAKPEYKPTLNIVGVAFTDNNSSLTSFSGGGLNAYDFGGGAIYSQGGYVNISGSSFTGNDAANGAGGAVHILRSNLVIADSSFTTNSAIGATVADSLGGAIYVDGLQESGGTFSIAGSSFTGNTAYNSGGAIHVNMYENSNRFSIDQSSFKDNAIVGGERAQGGAIGGGSTALGGPDTGNATIAITRSTFAGNSVRKSGTPEDGSGGALAFPQRAAITIANSTFSGNKAFGSSYNANGGAIYVVNNTTPFEITHSTIADNFAGWVGGGISNSDIGGNPGGILRNTIIANNSADNGPNDWNILQQCSSELTDGGGNLQWPARNPNPNYWNEVTCLKGKSAIAQRGLPDFRDPKLGPLADNGGPTMTLAPAADSPARDAAVATACPAIDQRGVSRPQGSACDIGAYELVPRLSISPTIVGAGEGGFTLTVLGEGFTTGSKVLWNGQERPTTFVDATTLGATIAGDDIAAPGEAQIGVAGSALPTATLRIVANLRRVYLPLALR